MLHKLTLDTFVPVSIVISLLGGAGYTGAVLYRVDKSDKAIEQMQSDMMSVKETLMEIRAELRHISSSKRK